MAKIEDFIKLLKFIGFRYFPTNDGLKRRIYIFTDPHTNHVYNIRIHIRIHDTIIFTYKNGFSLKDRFQREMLYDVESNIQYFNIELKRVIRKNKISKILK